MHHTKQIIFGELKIDCSELAKAINKWLPVAQKIHVIMMDLQKQMGEEVFWGHSDSLRLDGEDAIVLFHYVIAEMDDANRADISVVIMGYFDMHGNDAIQFHLTDLPMDRKLNEHDIRDAFDRYKLTKTDMLKLLSGHWYTQTNNDMEG